MYMKEVWRGRGGRGMRGKRGWEKRVGGSGRREEEGEREREREERGDEKTYAERMYEVRASTR